MFRYGLHACLHRPRARTSRPAAASRAHRRGAGEEHEAGRVGGPLDEQLARAAGLQAGQRGQHQLGPVAQRSQLRARVAQAHVPGARRCRVMVGLGKGEICNRQPRARGSRAPVGGPGGPAQSALTAVSCLVGCGGR